MKSVPWQKLPRGAEALDLTDGVPVEKILALDPDLVIAAFSITDEDSYTLLSDRVPTIAGSASVQVEQWQDMVRTAGKFLGEPDKAEQVKFFQQLGMTLYQPVVDEGTKTGQPRVRISTERADLLRADLLAFMVNGGTRDDLADIPGFDELPGTVAVIDYATAVGLNTPSPLSIPYSLGKLKPYLKDAAA